MLIHPFQHPDIITGQGTLGFEIIEQCPQVRTVVIPVGGGGRAAGGAAGPVVLDRRQDPGDQLQPEVLPQPSQT